MTFALIKDDRVVVYPYSLTTFRSDNPAISLPQDPTEAQLNEQGIYTVHSSTPPFYNWITESCVEDQPVEIEGKWIQAWLVVQATQQEIAARSIEAKQSNKSQAMSLLTETDWTQMPDVLLVNKDEFTVYRSKLRTIAINPPVEVQEWPVKPEEVWS